jgi:hypothetical protein
MAGLINGEAVFVDAMPREKHDFYPTPPEPTRAILNAESAHLSRFNAIWEPACGDGAMMREIEAAGHLAIGSDMIDRNCGAEIRSFYDFDTAPAPAILTNPPFNECTSGRWIEHALSTLGVEYMALLLPFNWPGAATRVGLWSRHAPARVYLMRWRIDFTGAGAPPMLNAWFVWDGKCSPSDTRLLMLDRTNASLTGGLDI